MTLVRVTVAGTIGKAVRINTAATIGSQIGVDFQLPDGTVPTLGELADALYIQSPPGEFVPDTGLTAGGHSHFESEIIDGLLLARVADNEVITGAYTFDTNLTMGNAVPINWKDAFGTKVQFLNLSAGGGALGVEVGHATARAATSEQTTSITYVSFTGATILNSALDDNEDYLIYVRGLTSNLTSQSTPLNGARLTYNGAEIGNSEMLYESKNGATNDRGHPYQFCGVINSGVAGDLVLQFKSGNGTDTVDMQHVTMLMIKVSDLTLNTNIFTSKSTGLVELDDGNFPPLVDFDLGVSLTIGDGSSDYLILGCVGIGDFLTGGNTVTIKMLKDGGSAKVMAQYVRADNSDEIPMGIVGFYEAPTAGTAITLTGVGTGFPVDKKYAFLAAIKMSAFAEVHKNYVATGPTLSGFPGDTDIATFNVSTTLASNNWCFFGSTTENWAGSTQTEHALVRANIGGAGDVTFAGDAARRIEADGTTHTVSRFMVSDDVVIGASVTIDADLQLGHPTNVAGDGLIETILLAFTWELKPAGAFEIGDANFVTTIKGSAVNVTAPLTAVSYDGVLATNLLDKSATEQVDGVWTFANVQTIFESAAPQILMKETDAAADNGKWRFLVNTEKFRFQTMNDAEGATADIMQVERTGITIDSIAFGGPVTATSYSGILAANLLDRTVNEIVTGRWDFESDGSAPQLCIVDSDSNGAATRAFIEFLGKGDVLTGRMGYLSAASGIFTIDNALPNAGVELKSAGVQKLRADIDGITLSDTLFVENTSGEKVVLKDTDSTGNAVLNFIAFKDMNDLRQGVVGFGSSSNDDLIVQTDAGFGDVILNPQGVTALRASNTAVAISVPLTATSYDGVLAANLLDRSAAETITESWTWSGSADTITFTGGGPFGIQFRSTSSTTAQQIDLLYRTTPDTLAFERTSDAVKIIEINASTLGVDFAGAITAASYDGILAANLLDKSAAESIPGLWNFTGNIRIKNNQPTFFLEEDDAAADEKIWKIVTAGGDLFVQTRTDLDGGGATPIRITRVGTNVTTMAFASLDLDVGGAITATSYGGITEANLLDKTATEDVTGSYTFSVGPTFFSAGTEGAPGTAFVGDSDTGVYSPGANIYAITVGGTEAVRYTGASAPLIRTGMNSGVTASTTQTQAGATPLTASWNEVAVVANNNDAVVLPSMVKGETCVVINSSAKKLQVFPALGKDSGAGIDASVTIKANSSRYWFHYDDVVGFDIATDFKNLQGVDTIGASANDLLYFDGVDWKHTNGDLTWDGVTLRAVIFKPVKYVQHRTASTANLNDITHAVNTDPGKVEGAQVFNTNLNTPVWAKGSADGDKWVNGIGVVIHDPV